MNRSKSVICLIILVIFIIVSLPKSSTAQGYDIKIKVEGLTDSIAVLGYYFGNKKYLVGDTAVVSAKGEVQFTGESKLKTGIYFLYSKSYFLEFIVNEPKFSLATTKDNAYPAMKITNSPSNVDYKKFQMIMIDHQIKTKTLSAGLEHATTREDTTVIYDQIRDLVKRNESQRDSLKLTLTDPFVKQILTMMGKSPELSFTTDTVTIEQRRAQYGYFKAHFFDGYDFDSEGLIRTPLLHTKVMEYVESITIQNPDSIIASVDYLLDRFKKNEEAYRYFMVTFFQQYQNPKIMGLDKVFVHLSDQYYLAGKVTWADTATIRKLKEELIFHRENQIGLKAPPMQLVDTLKQSKSLYNIQSEYIVLYFYSPTCGHCRTKTPVLKQVYDRIGDDVEVVAISTDTDINKWKEFIKEFDLNWINLADLDYKSNFRVQYNVRSTPVIYVLDRNKKIIAKKLDVDQLEDFIENTRKMPVAPAQ